MGKIQQVVTTDKKKNQQNNICRICGINISNDLKIWVCLKKKKKQNNVELKYWIRSEEINNKNSNLKQLKNYLKKKEEDFLWIAYIVFVELFVPKMKKTTQLHLNIMLAFFHKLNAKHKIHVN